MREIKFRAWDTVTKQMFYVNDMSRIIIYDGDWAIEKSREGELFGRHTILKEAKVDEMETHLINEKTYFSFKGIEPGKLERDTGILMQYTGLKDKNGVEIYEGDILNSRQFFDKNMVVFYDIGTCSYDLRDTPDEDWGCSEHLCQLDKDDCFKWEVIGNIYSNPELIEVKK